MYIAIMILNHKTDLPDAYLEPIKTSMIRLFG